MSKRYLILILCYAEKINNEKIVEQIQVQTKQQKK